MVTEDAIAHHPPIMWPENQANSPCQRRVPALCGGASTLRLAARIGDYGAGDVAGLTVVRGIGAVHPRRVADVEVDVRGDRVSARSRSLKALPRFAMRVLNAAALVPLVATTVSMRVRAVRTRFTCALFRFGTPERTFRATPHGDFRSFPVERVAPRLEQDLSWPGFGRRRDCASDRRLRRGRSTCASGGDSDTVRRDAGPLDPGTS